MTNFRKIVPNLRHDESIYVFVRSYFVAFLPWILLGFAMLIVGAIIVGIAYFTFPEIQANPMAANVLVILASAYFLLIIPFITVAFIDYYYDLHIVTDCRLIDVDQHSLFARENNELALEEVQDVTSRNVGILGSVFDFGFISVETSSATQKFEFDNVRHPREIAGIILDLSDQAKRRIESGQTVPVIPTGRIKADIDDVLYERIEPLVKIGAITSQDLEGIKNQSDTNSESREEHTIMLGDIPASHEEEPKHLTQQSQARSNEEGEDLDIIIDDPGQSKRNK